LRAPARVVDLTCDLFNGMPTYPGDPPFRHQFVIRGSRDGEVTLSRVESGLHSGTHVDAPLHFIPGGDSVDRVSPAKLVVSADLVDLTSKGPGQPITRDDLMGRVRPGRAAVLYTGFSALRGSLVPEGRVARVCGHPVEEVARQVNNSNRRPQAEP